jgi:hypothetical protein
MNEPQINEISRAPVFLRNHMMDVGFLAILGTVTSYADHLTGAECLPQFCRLSRLENQGLRRRRKAAPFPKGAVF